MVKKNNEILALTQRQHLIKRMNLTFGRETGDSDSPFSSQKLVAIREISDNAIDAIKKYNKNQTGTIKVVFFEDESVEVYDNGPGIPVTLNKTADGRPASSLYLAMGVMNAGSNYKDVTDSLGTNGVGGSGCVLLSNYVQIEVYQNKKVYKLDFKDGEPGHFATDEKSKFVPLKDLSYLEEYKDNRNREEKKLFPTGTKIRLRLDDSLFSSEYSYNVDDLIERLKGVSFLSPGITILVENRNRIMPDGSYQSETFNFTGGIKELADLTIAGTPLTKIHSIDNSEKMIEKNVQVILDDGSMVAQDIEKNVKVELAFAYNNNYDYYLDSYVNTIKTRLGGVHVSAFENAFVNTFNNKFRSMKTGLNKNDIDPIFNDYAEGLTAIVSVSIPEPQFTNQIKEELGGRAAYRIMLKLYSKALEDWISASKNQEDLRKIAEKVITAVRNRQKTKEALELKRERNKMERNSTMPTKLVDCEYTYHPDAEFYIAEGDSAMGALKGARDSRFQALFPIRGKLKNVLKTSMKDALTNQEVQDIIKCIDAGFGKEFDIEKMRYGKIFIAADADMDGKNIACLILVLVDTVFPGAIEDNRIYNMLTPLYIISTKTDTYYCYNDEERDYTITQLEKTRKKFTMVRAKGLGETGAEVLWETGMNPETRKVELITKENIDEAKKWLEIAMGDDVSIRREWIEANPLDVED